MNHTELKTFVAVAEAQSVSTAALSLHLSQPAVTRRIQNLEQSLDTVLFNRVGKRLDLTQAGILLLDKAYRILELWTDAERSLNNLSQNVSGTLHLATSHHIGLHRLAPVLTKFRRTYPAVQLNIAFEDSEITHEMVRTGHIELAVATLDPAGSGELEVHQIWHDPLIVVDRRAYKASLAELAQNHCVLPGTETYTGRIVLDWFTRHGHNVQPAMSTNYLETIHMLVGVGLGWSVLPKSMQGKLKEVEVAETLPADLSRDLGVVVNPRRVLSNAANAFMETLAEFADPG